MDLINRLLVSSINDLSPENKVQVIKRLLKQPGFKRVWVITKTKVGKTTSVAWKEILQSVLENEYTKLSNDTLKILESEN